MQGIESPRRQVSARQLAWLRTQSDEWQADGLVDGATRAAILDRYSAESAERRGMVALVLLAAGMFSVGLLLLVGYNWAQIPRAAKLTLVIGAVAAAFASSAFAYARQRRGAAETLAFFGVLLLGNGIWLVAQILHMQGRASDAFLWWGLGALACTTLVRSRWAGALAGAILFAWVASDIDYSRGPGLEFLVIWPLAIAVAYSVRSSLMVRIVAPSAAVAVFLSRIDNSHSAFWLGAIALVGAALYGTGRWHEPDSRMRHAWQASGLLVLLLVSIPLMVTDIHKDIRPRDADVALALIALAAAAAAVLSSWRPRRTPADAAVLAVTVGASAWSLARWSGWFGESAGIAMAGTVLFSVLTLVLAVALIRTALVSNRVADLAAGVLFALVFLIVRWTSVIQNLLWSGLLLVTAGAGLLLVARLWRQRQRVAAGRMS